MPTKSNVHKFLVEQPSPTVEGFLSRPGVPAEVVEKPQVSRGELGCFMATLRDSPSVLHQGPESRSGPGCSLEDVWVKAMFSKPAEMRELDRDAIMSVNPETGKVLVPRYVPEAFSKGKVQQPHVVLEEVEPSLFTDDGATLMSPQERRARHDTLTNCKLGMKVLREAYVMKGKLVLNCQKNFPHGALNVKESPFCEEGAMRDVYASNRDVLVKQQAVANRSGKGKGVQQQSQMRDILNHE